MGDWSFGVMVADDLDIYIMSKPDVSAVDGVSLTPLPLTL